MRSTREGKRFLLGTALIAVAAVNTGNNLIYLILSLMLSFLLLSFLFARINLSGLHIDVAIDRMIIAGVMTRARIIVTNGDRLVPRYSVRVLSGVLRKELSFHRIPAKGSAEATADVLFEKRGVHPELIFTAGSSFPFILFYSCKTVRLAKNFLVYPSYYDIDPAHYAAYFRTGEGRARPAGNGSDIFQLRDYRDGDDPKRIHWKATAKRSVLMTREYAEQDGSMVTIVLDNTAPDLSGDFEKAVSLTASLARFFTGRGDLVRVVSGGSMVPFGHGQEHLQRILDMLAVIAEDGTGQGVTVPDDRGFIISVLKSHEGNQSGVSYAGGEVVYVDTV
ncbi:MAG: DUF58 domain-containing protein [Nitrospiraceae bacterium]|nr:DUF58 domain-containing protein [Nitrospiraceae bacterium]